MCGGRDYGTVRDPRDPASVSQAFAEIEAMDRVLSGTEGEWMLVHGAARGADTLARKWAERNGIPHEPHPAKWDELGRAAGVIRNQEMLDTGIDLVVAFPGGRGTAHMVGIARAAGVPIFEVR